MKPKKEQAQLEHPLRLIKSNLETEILEREDLSNFVLKCPQCDSKEIAKSGRTGTGKPNFQCKKCKRQFVHPLLREQKNKKSLASIEHPLVYCYHCESQNRDFVYRGQDEKGRKRFYCNDCQKRFIDPKQRFVPDIACPKCKKSGLTQIRKEKTDQTLIDISKTKKSSTLCAQKN